MWLKLCLLLMYITVLFLLARILETVTWYETGSLSRRLLDPMALSVAKLKALLEQRGVSYDTVVEKSELCQLVDGSGQLDADEVENLQLSEDQSSSDTNFTSGAHFYEQVEDAKDSVWLVQVLAYSRQSHYTVPVLPNTEWKAIRKKVTKFGVHTGILDCGLDHRWCEGRGWHSSRLLLALPQVHQQKANVATHMYPGNWRQHLISQWIRQMLQEKVETIHDFRQFKDEWLNFRSAWEDSEIRAVLFSREEAIPLFFSALSVRFPGRVRFGVVNNYSDSPKEWTKAFHLEMNKTIPIYLILTKEKIYVYGNNYGECLSFACMERFLKFLYPCLNDIFIISFAAANILSVIEFFVAQGRLGRRTRRMLWCLAKYNSAVIMLWLPLIAIFQLPFLKDLPYIALKVGRVLATSCLGAALRRDYFFYSHHPELVAASFLSVCSLFGLLAYWFTGGRFDEEDESWFNFSQMRTLTHLHPNYFFEPTHMSGNDVSGRMELFGSRLLVPTLSLRPVVSTSYVSLLPTWCYGCVIQSVSTCCTKLSAVPQASACPSHTGDTKRVPNTKNLAACQTTPFREFESSSPSCTDCTSALDLLDGNYHCECQGSVREYSRTNKAVPSLTCEPDSSHASSSNVKCPSQKDHNPSHQNLQSKQSNTCHHHSTCIPERKTHTTPHTEFPDGYMACSQCVICLEEFIIGVKLCGLPCGHVFHHACITAWLGGDHHFCPICRWPSFRSRSHEKSTANDI